MGFTLFLPASHESSKWHRPPPPHWHQYMYPSPTSGRQQKKHDVDNKPMEGMHASGARCGIAWTKDGGVVTLGAQGGCHIGFYLNLAELAYRECSCNFVAIECACGRILRCCVLQHRVEHLNPPFTCVGPRGQLDRLDRGCSRHNASHICVGERF